MAVLTAARNKVEPPTGVYPQTRRRVKRQGRDRDTSTLSRLLAVTKNMPIEGERSGRSKPRADQSNRAYHNESSEEASGHRCRPSDGSLPRLTDVA